MRCLNGGSNCIQVALRHGPSLVHGRQYRVKMLSQLTGALEAPPGAIALQALVQGLLTAVISYVIYGLAIGILGASSGAAFAASCPAMTALMGIPILGEWPSPIDWIAIAIISVGRVRHQRGAPAGTQ